jgi:hypothetical protein
VQKGVMRLQYIEIDDHMADIYQGTEKTKV